MAIHGTRTRRYVRHATLSILVLLVPVTWGLFTWADSPHSRRSGSSEDSYYEATALIHVVPPSAKDDDSWERYQSNQVTQAVLVTSRSVLASALARKQDNSDEPIAELPLLADQEQPVDWLAARLAATFPRDGELMKLTIRGDDGEQLRAILAAVVEAYLMQNESITRYSQVDRLDRVTNQSAQLARQVDEKKKHYSRLARDLGGTDLSNQVYQKRLLSDELNRAYTQKMEVDSQITEWQLKAAKLRTRIEGAESLVTEAEIEKALATDPEYHALLDQRQAFADHLREALTATTDRKDEVVLQLQSAVNELQQKLEQRELALRPQIRERATAEQTTKSRLDLKHCENAIQILKQRIARLDENISELETRQERLVSATQTLDALGAEIQLLEESRNAVSAAQIQIQLGLDSTARLVLVDAPSVRVLRSRLD